MDEYKIKTEKGEYAVDKVLGKGFRGRCFAITDPQGKEYAGFIRTTNELTPEETAIYEGIAQLAIPYEEVHLVPLIDKVPMGGDRLLMLHPRYASANVGEMFGIFHTSSRQLSERIGNVVYHPLGYKAYQLLLEHVATAVDILHTDPALGYAHKDIGLSNVLVAEEGLEFFLGDFHSAEIANKRNTQKDRQMFVNMIKASLTYPFLYDAIYSEFYSSLEISDEDELAAVADKYATFLIDYTAKGGSIEGFVNFTKGLGFHGKAQEDKVFTRIARMDILNATLRRRNFPPKLCQLLDNFANTRGRQINKEEFRLLVRKIFDNFGEQIFTASSFQY